MSFKIGYNSNKVIVPTGCFIDTISAKNVRISLGMIPNTNPGS
jgi:hypothetical protein